MSIIIIQWYGKAEILLWQCDIPVENNEFIHLIPWECICVPINYSFQIIHQLVDIRRTISIFLLFFTATNWLFIQGRTCPTNKVAFLWGYHHLHHYNTSHSYFYIEKILWSVLEIVAIRSKPVTKNKISLPIGIWYSRTANEMGTSNIVSVDIPRNIYAAWKIVSMSFPRHLSSSFSTSLCSWYYYTTSPSSFLKYSSLAVRKVVYFMTHCSTSFPSPFPHFSREFEVVVLLMITGGQYKYFASEHTIQTKHDDPFPELSRDKMSNELFCPPSLAERIPKKLCPVTGN